MSGLWQGKLYVFLLVLVHHISAVLVPFYVPDCVETIILGSFSHKTSTVYFRVESYTTFRCSTILDVILRTYLASESFFLKKKKIEITCGIRQLVG